MDYNDAAKKSAITLLANLAAKRPDVLKIIESRINTAMRDIVQFGPEHLYAMNDESLETAAMEILAGVAFEMAMNEVRKG